MKLTAALTCLFTAAALTACAEKRDKTASERRDRSAARTATAGGAGTGTGTGTGVATTRTGGATRPGGTGAAAADPAASGERTATLDEARPQLVAALKPIADRLQSAMTGGCLQATDRVAAMFREADDAADDLHVMMRDPALRAELAAAIKNRTDPAIAKVMTRIDTSMVGCNEAHQQMLKGIDRLLQPAVVVPE